MVSLCTGQMGYVLQNPALLYILTSLTARVDYNRNLQYEQVKDDWQSTTTLTLWDSLKIEIQVIQTKVDLSDKCGNRAIDLCFIPKSNVFDCSCLVP